MRYCYASMILKYSQDDILNDLPAEFPINKPLWDFKYNSSALEILKNGDKYMYAAQIQQQPNPLTGGIFKDAYWKHYDILPSDIYVTRIYGDTAQKTAEHNDYSVFQCWAKSESKGIFLIDQLRGKWEAPELESKLVEFWNKHKPSLYNSCGAQVVKIEDKSSGSSLIQSIQRNYNIPVEGIQRNRDKFFRAMGVVNFFSSGHINLPNDADFMNDYKEEFRKFTPLMNHKHDDQIDPTMDAVEDLLINEDLLYTTNSIMN